MSGRPFTTAEAARAFILAGNARVTLVSVKTGTRYTYRVRQADEKPLWFVSLLAGSDNESDYVYLGIIRDGAFSLTKKSHMVPTSQPVVAFSWTFSKLSQGMPEQVEIWHEGRCGRCGRTLTVPESIESGFGPECIHHV